MADKMYLVFDDGSTYAGNGYVAVLTPAGQEKLEAYNDFKVVDLREHTHIIDLSDLLSAYDKIHGTKFLDVWKQSGQ